MPRWAYEKPEEDHTENIARDEMWVIVLLFSAMCITLYLLGVV